MAPNNSNNYSYCFNNCGKYDFVKLNNGDCLCCNCQTIHRHCSYNIKVQTEIENTQDFKISYKGYYNYDGEENKDIKKEKNIKSYSKLYWSRYLQNKLLI